MLELRELVPGFQWTEDGQEIVSRWRQAGGRCLEETRLIAAKWDQVWSRFAGLFPNGYGDPYPPYSPESCAHWRKTGVDAAIVVGVITEEELQSHTPRDPEAASEVAAAFDRLSPEDRAALIKELDELCGPAGRADRHARSKVEERARIAEAARIYAERNRERDAVDQVFRRMTRMDEIFTAKQMERPNSAGVLMTELQALITSPVFDRYPHWRARDPLRGRAAGGRRAAGRGSGILPLRDRVGPWLAVEAKDCRVAKEAQSSKERPPMKEALLLITVLLLAVLVYRVPTALEIGEGIIRAQHNEESRILTARLDRAERERTGTTKEQVATRRIREQEAFDALPKWDGFGRPINRTPPEGLQPTPNIPLPARGTYGNPL